MRQRVLLALTVLGFLVAEAFVVAYLVEHGFEPGNYLEAFFETLPAAQASADLLITSLAVFVWASWDGPRSGVRSWWVVIPATMLVGLCFGVPLYLYLRERAVGEGTAVAPAAHA